MPSSRRRVGPPRVSRLACVALLAAVVAGCSAQPVSDVGEVPETAAPSLPASGPPASDVPASEPASSAQESEEPPSETPAPTPTEDPNVPAPSKPIDTKIVLVSEQPTDDGGVKQTYRLTWDVSDSRATSFLVYGLKTCFRASKANNGTPCVTRGIHIEKEDIDLLAQPSGTDRSADIEWVVPKSGKQPYVGVLMRSSNAAGNSIFTIVFSADVCWGC